MVAFRTIPVTVSFENKKMVVNALLDDCSDTSYITEDAAQMLGVTGPAHESSVEVMGGHDFPLKGSKVTLHYLNQLC